MTVQQEPVAEDVTDNIPYFEDGGVESPLKAAAPVPVPAQQFPVGQQGGGGVNVQTSNQPVLVIPMNVGTPTAPTQLIDSPRPGAPKTIAVDTTTNAMRQQGLPQMNGGGGGGNTKKGNSPSARVNVEKKGGSSPSASPSNVVVNVTKHS